MLHRPAGNSGLTISTIGLGCWAIGGPFRDATGWIGYGDNDDAEAIRAIHLALDLGVTFFDTASVYGCGHSERLLGQALQGRGESVVISTKFGFRIDESTRTVTGPDASADFIRESCEDSLRRLRRECIELYTFQLWDHPADQLDPILTVLDALVDEGKIRSYTWLTDDPDRVRAFRRARHCWCAPMLLNIFESNPGLIRYAESENLLIPTRRPLCMGLLTGKFRPEDTFPENDMRRRFGWNFRTGKQAQRLQMLETLRGILTRDGRSVAQGSLGWVLARSPLAVPVPGFRNIAQVAENVRTIDFGPLTPEQMLEIEAVLQV